jgi:glycolate dehydrogenase FAD-binding subunit
MTDPAETAAADCSEQLASAVHDAIANREPLQICGGGSKAQWLGRSINAKPLNLASHCGIVDYQPSELVITARAGTKISDINALLSDQGQMLACESPSLHNTATIGGTVASNISGPARPWGGSIRDAVLGMQIINGRAQQLNFGGQVMKNVAGYDVSRLQAGALGTLGVITEVSLKVVPQPETTRTLVFDMSASDAIEKMNQRSAESAPLTGACWVDDRMYLRLSGNGSAVSFTAQQWGGEECEESAQPWHALQEMSHAFFEGDEALWRLSLKSTEPLSSELPGDTPQLIDWGGAQRWLRGQLDFQALQKVASAGGGHAVCFSGGNRGEEVRSSLDKAQEQIQLRLKHAFDPAGIFNPGRLYGWM